MKRGIENPMWAGVHVKVGSLHAWVRNNKPKPSVCEHCKQVPPLDLANISPKYNKQTYDRDFNHWLWLCRSCHMKQDGRHNNLKQGGKEQYYDSCLFCDSPHKAKGLCNKHYKQLNQYGVLYL